MGTLEWETCALGKASSDFHSQKPSTVFSDRQLHIFLFVSFSSLLLLTPFPLTCLTLRENRSEERALFQAVLG